MSDKGCPSAQATSPGRKLKKPPVSTLVWIRYIRGKQDHAAFLINQTDDSVHVQWCTTNNYQWISKHEVTIIDDSTFLDRRGRHRHRSNNDVATVPETKKAAVKTTPAEEQQPPHNKRGSSSARKSMVKKEPVTKSIRNLLPNDSVSKTQRNSSGDKMQNKKAAPTSSEHDNLTVQNGSTTNGSKNEEENKKKKETPPKSRKRTKRTSRHENTDKTKARERSLFKASPVNSSTNDTLDDCQLKDSNLDPSVKFNGYVDPTIEGRIKRRRRRIMEKDRRRLASGPEDEGEPSDDINEPPGLVRSYAGSGIDSPLEEDDNHSYTYK
jgi:hypothetical protein